MTNELADKLEHLEFDGHVSAIRTSLGGWRLCIDLFEADLVTATKLPGFFQSNVKVALVKIPDGE